MPSLPSRRTLLIAAAATVAGPAFARTPSPPGPQARTRVVTMLGDSITAGLGLPASQALPARLEWQLNRYSGRTRVRAAGVSGDTTAGGLARVNFSVQPDTDLCLVALGGNDLLQGIDVRTTEANLGAIVRRLKARRIPVALAGLSAPSAIGARYARDFTALFARIAAREHVALYPDLLAGVARIPSLNQPDGIHPNARGVLVIAQRLAPFVHRQLLAARP
jgi:acyl-CoA thioesterase-1